MTPLRILHLLMFSVTCAWGTSSLAVRGAMLGDAPLPQLISELQHMSPDQRDEVLSGFDEELARSSLFDRMQKRQWLKQQLVTLSPEQRDQLHKQVLEHCNRIRAVQRERIRELHRQISEPAYEDPSWQKYHSQSLSPEERHEFHQWMRIRRERAQ